MTYPVITSWSIPPHALPRRVEATTDTPTHLALTYSPYYPAATPRYKWLRGKQHICGFYLKWHAYYCEQQQEPGPTYQHTFLTPGMPANQEGWCCIAESCHPQPKEFASIPMPLTIASVDPALHVFDLSHVTTTSIPASSTLDLTWSQIDFEQHWPLPATPFQYPVTPVTAVYDFIQRISITPSGPGLTEIHCRALPPFLTEWASDLWAGPAGVTHTFEANGFATLAAPRSLTIRIINFRSTPTAISSPIGLPNRWRATSRTP